MEDKQRQHSGIDTVKRIVSAARIAKAAAAGGVHGAAVAAAKETAPFLAKLAIWVLVALIALPKEGNKRRSAEINADNVYFGDSRPAQAEGASGYGEADAFKDFPPLDDFPSAAGSPDKELPF